MTQSIDTGEESFFSQHLLAHWIVISSYGEHRHPSASLKEEMGTHAQSPDGSYIVTLLVMCLLVIEGLLEVRG